MPHEAFGWNTRIKAVEREYITARLAMDRLDQQAKDDPAVLTGGLRIRDDRGVALELQAVSGQPRGNERPRLRTAPQRFPTVHWTLLHHC